MRKDRLIKSTMLGLGVVGAMLINMTNATSSYIHEQYDEEHDVNTLTICDWYGDCITMKDRNEGATKAGTECSSIDTGACGLRYQWGNNYGFDPRIDPISSGDTQVDCTNIGPSTYSSGTFIQGFDDWCSSSNDNLWGGSGDSEENNRGLDSENPITDRQGPCGEGYHVPSIGEWNQVVEHWAEENNYSLESYSNGLISDTRYRIINLTKFKEDFKTPFVIYPYADFWSSSPRVDYNEIACYFTLFPQKGVFAGYSTNRAYTQSVRCFKNSPLSFSSTRDTVKIRVMVDGDILYEGEIPVGSKFSDNEDLMAILNQDMSKVGYMFLGWYDKKSGEKIDFNAVPTNHTKIVAKYTYIYERTVGGVNTLTICDQNSENCITMKDRNEGCSAIDTGSSCGLYYKWGNNIAGDSTTYNGVDNNNMWGGSGDSESNRRGLDSQNPITDRQGPCGEGYHVPSIGEWSKVLKYWAEKNNIEVYDSYGPYNLCGLGVGTFRKLVEDFNINRHRNDDIMPTSLYGVWSSSPYFHDSPYLDDGNVYGYNVYFTLGGDGCMRVNSNSRDRDYHVRCFKDTPLRFPSNVILKGIDEGGNREIEIWSGMVEYGETLPEEALEAISGYVNSNTGESFFGWYVNGTNKIFDITSNIASDVTLVASWNISICDQYDTNKCVTIMDRNLGAKSNDRTNKSSYGNHYQRGNGYGFAPCSKNSCETFPNKETTKSDNRVDTISGGYGPGKFYSSKIYRKTTKSPFDWSNPKNNNLWGGSGDSQENNRGIDSENSITDRQGPCPEGYHVPSRGEWTELIDIWLGSDSSGHIEYDAAFLDRFKIPLAGYRSNNAVVTKMGESAYIWSSTPVAEESRAHYLYINGEAGISANTSSTRAPASSLRCFKDSAIAVPSSNIVEIKVVVDGDILYELEMPAGSKFSENVELMEILNQDMSKSGWRFLGWYDERGGVKINFDTVPTNNTKIVAKYTYIYEKEVDGINTITICDQNWGNCITMKDRNEGATEAGKDCYNCGRRFQRGNNYGFDPLTTPTTGDTQVDCTNISPSTYSSEILIQGFNDWCSLENDNLWGGSGDSQENNRGLSSLNPITGRQGPCGSGYHVPSIGEWNQVLENRAAKNDFVFEGTASNGQLFSWSIMGSSFQEDFKINYSDILWLSTPGIRNGFALYFTLEPMVSLANSDLSRSDKRPVRCFKNEPLSFPSSVVVKIMDGDEEKNSRVVETEDVLPTYVIERMSEYANTNPGYTLSGWYDEDAESRWTPEMEVEAGFTLRAVWTKNQTEEPISTSNGSHGGGGSTISKDYCPNGDFSDSYYDGTCGTKPQNDKEVSSGVNEEVVESLEEISSSEGQGNNELQTAYEFAYKNGITTMDTIEDADMMGNLNRISMAKMLSKYAINVLGKKPANTIVPKFSDVTVDLNAEYDYGVTLAYQLGIMGINMPDNKFRPFDLVTRAEFVTALSRLLYNTEDGEKLYYSTHMELLNKMGIISVTDPDMEELRGYVMLMLMRSAK